MSNTATIKVALKIDDQGVVRGFKDISSASEKAGAKGVKAFDSLGNSAKATTAMLKQMSVVAAGLSAGIGLMVKQSIDAVSEIDRLATMAGVSAEAFQELSFAAEQYQISQDALTDGMKELSLRGDEFVKTGAGPAKESFERLGYSTDDLNKLLSNTPALLSDIISRMQGLDKAAQIRIADEIFGGTGGEQFVAMIQGGANALDTMRRSARDLGLVIDNDMVKQSVEAQKQVKQLTTILSAKFNSAVADLAPDIADVAQKMTNWVQANKNLIGQKTDQYITDTKDAVKGAYDVLSDVKRLYDSLPDSIKGDVGVGLAGAIMFGPTGGALIGSGSYLLGEFKDFFEGLEGLQAGKINLSEFVGDESVFEAALERYRKYKESLAAVDKQYPINSDTPGYEHYAAGFFNQNSNSGGGGSGSGSGGGSTDKLAAERERIWQKAFSSMDTITQGVYDHMLEYYTRDYERFVALTGDKEAALADFSKKMTALHEKMYGADTYDLDYGSTDDNAEKEAAYLELYQKFGVVSRQAYEAMAAEYADDRDAFIDATGDKEKAWEAYFKRMQGLNEDFNELFADDTYDIDYGSAEDGLDDLAAKGDETSQSLKEAFSGWATSYSSSLTEMLWESDYSFSSIAESFGKMLTQMAIQKSLSGLFDADWGEIGTSFMGLFTSNAAGGMYAGPGISAWENQIVKSPTIFPFAKGIGLMGEAGDEVIMPISRMSSGNMGVEARVTTGQSQAPALYQTINIQEGAGTQASVEQSDDGMTLNIIIEQVEQSITGRMSRGTGLASFLDGRYGRRA